MYIKTNSLNNHAVHFYDKKTGEKFSKQSSMTFCRITHHTIKSESSGKILLLSSEGIKRRFTKTPYRECKNEKIFFNWFSKLR